MGYDIKLAKDGRPVEVPNHQEGGTIAIGGSNLAEVSLTYNYSNLFRQHLDAEKGLRWLYGKTGEETAERLAAAVAALGTEKADDYWAATPGNAGHALSILLEWAKAHPSAVWDGD